jgi:hypothetical protein
VREAESDGVKGSVTKKEKEYKSKGNTKNDSQEI